MKIPFDKLVIIPGEKPRWPKCYSVENHNYIGDIIAKGTLSELLVNFSHAFNGDPTEPEEEEVWPTDFDYVVVREKTGSTFDGDNVYNYDCDPCGVYSMKDLKQQLVEGDITLEAINNTLTDFNAEPVKIQSDMESHLWLWLISNEDFERLFNYEGLPITNITHYESVNCFCCYDYCGCLSSREIRVINNGNGWISIFFNVQFNY